MRLNRTIRIKDQNKWSRRITIDSTRVSVAVTPFARSVVAIGLSAKVAPEPPPVRPFQAGQEGATAECARET